MLDEPQIVQTAAQAIAMVRLTVPRAEIQNVMGPGLTELRAAVSAQGIAIVGPWFTHHLLMDPAVFDYEICVAVASPIAAAGRIQPSVRPAMKVARTVYRGGFEGLGAAWGEFNAWVAAEGLEPAKDLWEVYLAGPESSSDASKWATQLDRPLLP